MKLSKSGVMVLFIAAVVLSVVFANLVGLTRFVRVDLTRDGKYTLSQGSIETMKSLKDVMVVTAYFTEGLPTPYSSYTRYVRDLLEEYRAVSGEKLAFEFVDPLKEENEEDRQKKKEVVQDIFGGVMRNPTSIESEMMEHGITPVEIRVVEDDQQQTKRAYMGLVVRYQGKKEVMPMVQDFSNFEKEMTVLMRKLTRPRTPVIGVLNDVAGSSISHFKQLMGQSATVKEIANAQEVTKDIDALLVFGTGHTLSDETLKAVEFFIATGKNAAFFVDRYRFDPQSFKQLADKNSVSKLPQLLEKYGVTLQDELVADIHCREILIQEQRGSMVFGVPVHYPFFPAISSLEQENPVARGLFSVVFPFASPLTVATGKGSLFARSSEKSWLETPPFNTDPNRKWDAGEIEMSGPYGLAATVKGPGRILVFGTSAFVWDQYLTEDNNQALALASVDYLLADDVMLSMHSRTFAELPLDPSTSDAKRALIKYGNMLGLPALLILYGIVRWRRRENRRRTLTLDAIR